MSFRTVVIKNRCKLEYSMNYLVYRGEEEKRINLNEITTLIIQSTQVCITSALLSKLIDSKIKVIFCDTCNNPQSELIPYYGSYNVREKIINQVNISKEAMNTVWKRIVEEKILQQANNLKFMKLDDSYYKLVEYKKEVDLGDNSNREGHAAKVYFNALFGNDFSRDKEININKYLNYGYSIILSAFNREIKNLGYLTEIGIHHIGNLNPFNLSCDFVEPLRPLVDYYVISEKLNEENFKKELINILNIYVNIDDKRMILDNAIKVYIQSLFNALFDCNINKIKFIDYERL